MIPAKYTGKIRSLICNAELSFSQCNAAMADLRSICPEVRALTAHSVTGNEGKLPGDINLFLLYICQLSEMLKVNTLAEAVPQPGSYNPEK